MNSYAPEPQKGRTIIVCEGEKIEQCYNERGTIILEGTPLLKSCNVAVYHGVNHTVFYKNVKALQVLHCMYTYNILDKLELTEDRTIKYSFYARGAIMNAVLESHDRAFINAVLKAPNGTFEATFDFMDNSEAKSTPSNEFLDIASSLASKSEGNASAFAVFRKYVSFSQKPAKEARLTTNQKAMFDKAVMFCNSLGYDVQNYPIIITHELGHNVLGLAKEGKIYINIRAFQRGLRELSATLIEEFIHLDKGLLDESRAMQNYLFERLVDVAAELYQIEL